MSYRSEHSTVTEGRVYSVLRFLVGWIFYPVTAVWELSHQGGGTAAGICWAAFVFGILMPILVFIVASVLPLHLSFEIRCAITAVIYLLLGLGFRHEYKTGFDGTLF